MNSTAVPLDGRAVGIFGFEVDLAIGVIEKRDEAMGGVQQSVDGRLDSRPPGGADLTPRPRVCA